MIKQRLLTASVLIVLVASVLFYLPPLAWSCFLAVMLLLASWEWFGLLPRNSPAPRWHAIAYALLIALITQVLLCYVHPTALLAANLAATVFGCLAMSRYAKHTSAHTGLSHPLLQSVMGLCLLAPFIMSMHTLFLAPKGNWLLLGVMSVIWVNDSLAFAIGSAIGRHKLIPAISPNKTWEGFIGGWVCAILWGMLLAHLRWAHLAHPYYMVLLVALLALSANIGDLLISLLKRLAGKKDCSQLLPGHGGVLDRIDSLLTGLPLFLLGSHILGLISY